MTQSEKRKRTYMAGSAKSSGFTNFSIGREAAAKMLMSKRGMTDAAKQGNIYQAIQNGGKESASLLGPPYGQPKISMDNALQTYGQTIVSSGGLQMRFNQR